MTSFWNRFNFRIKHQLYLRILPVVAVSVLAVGAFSGRLLTSRAERTYLQQESLENTNALRRVVERISVQALLAEVQRDDRLMPLMRQAAPGTHRATAERFLGGMLRREAVRAAAIVSVGAGGRAAFVAAAFDTDLAVDADTDSLQSWVRGAWSGLASADWTDLQAGTSWSHGPRTVPIDRTHSLWIFDPLPLAHSRGGADMVLPTVVFEGALVPQDWGEASHAGRARMHVVLMLDIPSLLSDWFADGSAGELQPGEFQAAVDGRGRLLCASADTLAVGLDLTAPGPGVFHRVRGEDLAGLLHRNPADGIAQATLGSRLNPQSFLLARRPELPFGLVSALEMSNINGGFVLYTAIIVLMVAIALLGSILAITSVGERLSNRLQAMSVNMEEVAKGDFTRRMGVGTEDEVGRLISYFNQMTGDLADAHRLVNDKTRNLRVALDKMQRLDKAKDDFLALISHEVRTPLTSIIGGIDYLRVVLPGEETEQGQALAKLGVTEIVEIVENSGRRLSEFMNDAILMASLQSADLRVHVEPVAIADICGMVLSSLQEGIGAKSLTVDNELADAASWGPLCDREMLVVAIEKLLRNAVQHNVDGGRVRIREVATIPGLGAVAEALDERARQGFLDQPAMASWCEQGVTWRAVEMFNTGPHIPLDKREALFTKFELVGRIEHHQKGSGLSLPIVQAIMENHGGRIHVESVAGEGNYFYLIVPAVDLGGASPDEPGHGGVADAVPLEAEPDHVSV
ncbi:MAG: sensor histidine kinase [Candidatus Krumholzibacteriia bacterium]